MPGPISNTPPKQDLMLKETKQALQLPVVHHHDGATRYSKEVLWPTRGQPKWQTTVICAADWGGSYQLPM